MEAVASSRSIIAKTTARAITASLVTRSLHDVRTRGTFHKRAVRATTADVAHAPHMLVVIPRISVGSGSLKGKSFLSKAYSSITAFIRAHGTLTRNSFVIRKANALTTLSIANTLVGALNHGMSVVSFYYFANPCFIPNSKKDNRGDRERKRVRKFSVGRQGKNNGGAHACITQDVVTLAHPINHYELRSLTSGMSYQSNQRTSRRGHHRFYCSKYKHRPHRRTRVRYIH